MKAVNSCKFYRDKKVITTDDVYNRRNRKIYFFLEPYIRLENRKGIIRILDQGSGYGIDILSLREKLPAESSYYIGLEISPSQVLFANGEFKRRKITDVDFIIGDGTRLPFKDDSFDIVISNQVIEHICDKGNYLQQSYRVLKKEGVLLISTSNRVFPYEGHLRLPFIPWLPKSLAVRLLRLLSFKNAAKNSYYENLYPLSTFYLERLLKRSGFKVEYVVPKLVFDKEMLGAEVKASKRYIGQKSVKLFQSFKRIPRFNSLLKLGFPYVAFIGIARKNVQQDAGTCVDRKAL